MIEYLTGDAARERFAKAHAAAGILLAHIDAFAEKNDLFVAAVRERNEATFETTRRDRDSYLQQMRQVEPGRNWRYASGSNRWYGDPMRQLLLAVATLVSPCEHLVSEFQPDITAAILRAAPSTVMPTLGQAFCTECMPFSDPVPRVVPSLIVLLPDDECDFCRAETTIFNPVCVQLGATRWIGEVCDACKEILIAETTTQGGTNEQEEHS